MVREGRARGIEGASWHQENNLLRSVFIASDLLDILVPGLAGLFVQSVAIAVLPVAALAPPAQVAQLVHHDILQPCPARAPRRVPRLPRGRLARLQLILIKPTVCSLWSCSASQADTAGRQPRRAARRTRPGTRRRRPFRSLLGAPISRLSSQCPSIQGCCCLSHSRNSLPLFVSDPAQSEARAAGSSLIVRRRRPHLSLRLRSPSLSYRFDLAQASHRELCLPLQYLW